MFNMPAMGVLPFGAGGLQRSAGTPRELVNLRDGTWLASSKPERVHRA